MCQNDKFTHLIKIHGKNNISTDGDMYPSQSCKFLKVDHHLLFSYEKSIIIERTMQYIKIGPKVLMTIFQDEGQIVK